MTYQEAFKKIKEKFNDVKTNGFEDFFAIQVNLTDEDCGGIFYIEYKDAQLNIEPYDYIDRTTVVTSPRAEIMKVLNGTALAASAIEKGKIEVNGNVDCFITLADALKVANKKPAAKKAVKKIAEKKETENKVEDKKAEGAKAVAPKKVEEPKKVAPKKADTPKKVASKKTEEPKSEEIKLEIPEIKKTAKKSK